MTEQEKHDGTGRRRGRLRARRTLQSWDEQPLPDSALQLPRSLDAHRLARIWDGPVGATPELELAEETSSHDFADADVRHAA